MQVTHVSPARRRAAVAALALGGFAIGLTEFVAMGLLPQVARSLLGSQYTVSSSKAVAHAGWMISAYALGVVVGAPTIAAVTARVARKQLLLGLLALFIAGTAASAAAPNFELLLVARFVAALPHGAYFGAAGLLASQIMGPGSHGRGFAAVLGGLTVANVFGVPLITLVGQHAGWRVAYLAIAGVFGLTLIAVLALVPAIASPVEGSPRDELSAFRSGQVWLVATVAAIGFAGFFAVDSYIAPVTTHIAGLSDSWVPWVLATVGLGMTAGNAAGGWASDRNLDRSLLFGFGALIASTALFALIAHSPAGLFIGSFLIGASSLFLGPAMQSRLISAAPSARLMGAAVNQSAMNIANSLGAALGSLAIANGLGYLAPSVLGAGLAIVGLLLCSVDIAARRRARSGTQAGSLSETTAAAVGNG
ncbi:DHA1 family inner membrane transport protein [Catenulispora sp. MAP5-51]|uniref:MFS transporter n=1 Tax=Catenulispora sp. MAP5-51 TaxID=3156298 RepID=UPI0035197FB9